MEMLELAAELKWCRERIVALEAERDRLASRLKVVTTAISNAAEHQNYSAGSPYDTGWQDAVRWIKQYLHNATLKENNDE